MATGIYCITNCLNGKKYVGQAIDISRRWKSHKSRSVKGISAIHLALHHVGISNFSFEILEECGREVLNDRECFWIEHLDTIAPKGYNLNSGGKCPTVVSEETRKRQSLAKLGKPQPITVKEKRKLSMLKHLSDPEYHKKLSISRRKHSHSPEVYQKIAAAQRGKTVSLEQRINIARAHMRGKTISCSNGKIYYSTKEAALDCGVHTDSVLRVCNGKYKQAKGFIFWYTKVGV